MARWGRIPLIAATLLAALLMVGPASAAVLSARLSADGVTGMTGHLQGDITLLNAAYDADSAPKGWTLELSSPSIRVDSYETWGDEVIVDGQAANSMGVLD